jgi:hypothetical protein
MQKCGIWHAPRGSWGPVEMVQACWQYGGYAWAYSSTVGSLPTQLMCNHGAPHGSMCPHRPRLMPRFGGSVESFRRLFSAECSQGCHRDITVSECSGISHDRSTARLYEPVGVKVSTVLLLAVFTSPISVPWCCVSILKHCPVALLTTRLCGCASLTLCRCPVCFVLARQKGFETASRQTEDTVQY